jgi:hypothetical protein
LSAVKERTISAMNASTLASRDSAVMPVDRIGALAQAPSLGSNLWHTMNLDAQSLRQAVFRLARKIRGIRKVSQSMSEKVATQAITEKFIYHCPTCNGAKERMIGDVLRSCNACHGSGVRRYSDQERAKAIGVTLEQYGKGWGKLLASAMALVDEAEISTGVAVKEALK